MLSSSKTLALLHELFDLKQFLIVLKRSFSKIDRNDVLRAIIILSIYVDIFLIRDYFLNMQRQLSSKLVNLGVSLNYRQVSDSNCEVWHV